MHTKLFSLALLCGASILSAATPPAPSFKAVDIDTKIEIGYGVTVADVDGDKKPDIILADKNQIVWYQNPAWTKHVIAEKLTPLDHVCVAARDLDGDGKAEIAVGAGWNPNDTVNSGALFYLVPPADRTQRWAPVPLPHDPTVHRIRWVKIAPGAYALVSVPLHGRGNKDGAGAGVRIQAYKKPADPKEPWSTEVLNDALHKTHNFDPVQWDAGAEELLVAGKEGVFRIRHEDAQWKSTQLSGAESGGAGEVRFGKLPGGRRFFATVEPMHGSSLVAYSSPDNLAVRPSGDGSKLLLSGPLRLGGFNLWRRQVLDSTLVDGHALACGDLAGSGSDQVVVGWRAMGKPGVKVGIKLFTPLDAEGKEWRQALIDDNTMACEDLCLADLDGDGRPDIIAAGRATKNVKVYFNQGAK